ncbi:19226_t:CDS:2, partial [Gigaspora rosea]
MGYSKVAASVKFWAFVELESVKLELPNEIHWIWSRFMYDFNSFCGTF